MGLFLILLEVFGVVLSYVELGIINVGGEGSEGKGDYRLRLVFGFLFLFRLFEWGVLWCGCCCCCCRI